MIPANSPMFCALAISINGILAESDARVIMRISDLSMEFAPSAFNDSSACT